MVHEVAPRMNITQPSNCPDGTVTNAQPVICAVPAIFGDSGRSGEKVSGYMDILLAFAPPRADTASISSETVSPLGVRDHVALFAKAGGSSAPLWVPLSGPAVKDGELSRPQTRQ